jgi:hypothetical protein
VSLREQLLDIYEQHQMLTPALVVDEARRSTHPLHDRFEWNNNIAGEAWRRAQAHELIRLARVVVQPASDTEPERSVRAFHAVREEHAENNGYIYEPAERIAEDPFLRQIVLRDMERDWQALRKRYEEFSEFLTMIRTDIAAGE